MLDLQNITKKKIKEFAGAVIYDRGLDQLYLRCWTKTIKTLSTLIVTALMS